MNKKRTDFSTSEKAEILEKYDALPAMSQRKAVVALNIAQPTLCKILNSREGFLRVNRKMEIRRENESVQEKMQPLKLLILL